MTDKPDTPSLAHKPTSHTEIAGIPPNPREMEFEAVIRRRIKTPSLAPLEEHPPDAA